MSEYQYYEFQAIDRPLTAPELRALRAYSTRATITPTSFVNHYDWGGFGGNPRTLVAKYFDAHLYFSNWGTRWLMFRFPRRALDLRAVRRYCCGESMSARARDGFVVLEFAVSEIESDDDVDDGRGWLASLVPLRADIASGDYRTLYLAWLLGVQAGDVREDEAREPPVPPGLGRLTAPLRAFTELLRIDGDLIAVASSGSARGASGPRGEDVSRAIAGLSEKERRRLLGRVAVGEGSRVQTDLLRLAKRQTRAAARPAMGRTVTELRVAAERQAADRRRREAARAARARRRREQAEAAARDCYLAELASRESGAWRRSIR
ncbi:MAG: hypothetical protein ACT4PV_15230 [Planctomycetaceae bacterium]